MNLFIESIASHLKAEWDRVFRSAGSKEVRFIVQSLGPQDVVHLFKDLEEHRLEWLKELNVKCYFKVATKLWDEWTQVPGSAANLDSLMATGGGIDASGRKWIDEEDKLTWYRNRTTRDEQAEGLVVVLVGLQHATDQGGLKDFHRVDESRIWSQNGQSFEPWIERIQERMGLDGARADQFDIVLQELSKLRALSLGKLAEFLESIFVSSGQCYSVDDMNTRLLAELPHWGLPAIHADADSAGLTGKKAAKAIIEANTFISHQRYKTPKAREEDWKSIEAWLESDAFQMPRSGKGSSSIDTSEYKEILRQFIFEASAPAKAKLMEIDALPLLTILSKRKKKRAKQKDTTYSFGGGSLEALLHGIWKSLSAIGSRAVIRDLESIEVRLVRFDHDLVADEEENLGKDYLARELLLGCVGGLERVLEGMDCRVPADEEQIYLPRSFWEKHIGISLTGDIEEVVCGRSRSRPSVQFQVGLQLTNSEELDTYVYKWLLGPTQPERVRYECAKKVQNQWKGVDDSRVRLPAHGIPEVVMTALYYAADEDEANRLMSQAMAEMTPIDLLAGLPTDHLDSALSQSLKALFSHYRNWLSAFIRDGYYAARMDQLPQLLESFSNVTKKTLDPSLRGSKDLLRRFYKAFLVVEQGVEANDPYLPSAVAWGLSPAVLELTLARVSFLSDSFPEVIGELALGRENGASAAFARMLDLAEIHRPLAGLVVNPDQTLSPAIKSFGLIHYLGFPPSTNKSLAVQSLLRDDESADHDDIAETLGLCEERDLVVRVLEDYQQLYPFAEDGLRILAVNVRELQTIIAGVDRFLENYLKSTSSDWPPFHCSLMIYSTSSSPMAVENRISSWRDHLVERRREKGRPLIMSVGHRYAPKEKIIGLLDQEQQVYDVAFLFHFLRGELSGQAEPASPFEFSFAGWNGLQFPIAEYPRPAIKGDHYRRQTVLSNRRLRIQSRHADMSARLRYPTQIGNEHVIVGEVDYKPWVSIVQALHRRAHWLASVDPFVDKGLLTTDDEKGCRKVVGFKSGLGAYGELNLTISTQQDTLYQLTQMVAGQLTKLVPHSPPAAFEQMAVRVVSEAEEVIGLASLRAVVGTHERIREVVGFAAIQRALSTPPGVICQMLPVDSVLHWFKDSALPQRPDLLQLSLESRKGHPPVVHAVLIECKLGQENSQTLTKACEQVQDGLQHLTELLSPMRADLRRIGFDRRYWWAQLHRAMTSRSVVSMPEEDRTQLNRALERLAEGDYEIRWQAAVFTFWTDIPDELPTISRIGVPSGTVPPPFKAPVGFGLTHIQVGYKGLAALFADSPPWPPIKLEGPPLCILSDSSPSDSSNYEALPPETKKQESQATLHFADETTVKPTIEISEPVEEIQVVQSPVTDSMTVVQTTSEPQLVPPPPSRLLTAGPPALPVVPTSGSSDEEKVAHTEPVAPAPAIAPQSMLEINGPSSEAQNITLPLTPRIPEQILIGTRKQGEPVYWHFGHPQLANRHLLLFGASGSGKTYGIQCLLSEMAKQNLHSLVVDYTDGFLPNQVESRFNETATPKNHYVITDRLPLNPFRRQTQIIDPSAPAFEENPYQVATRLQSIFASVYEMGDQQAAALIRVLESGIAESSNFGLDDIVPRLEADNKNAATLASKILPLVKAQPFRQSTDSNWNEMFESPDNMVHVLQLKGYAREIWRLITEFVLWDLWDYAQSTGSKSRPLPIVLDEIQNLDHSSDSPIDKMLREGRKFGLAMILATQTTSQFNQEQKDRLFQAGHKLFFKPASSEVDRFASLLAATTPESKAIWTQRLSSLEKGQCWSLGPVMKAGGAFKEEAVFVKVTPLEHRAL